MYKKIKIIIVLQILFYLHIVCYTTVEDSCYCTVRTQKQSKRTNRCVVSTKIQSVIKFLNVSENAEMVAFQIFTEIDFESEAK